MRELLVCGPAVVGTGLDELGSRFRAAKHVDRNVASDREHPGAKMPTVVDSAVRLKRAQECLLKRILRSLRAQTAAQEPEHLGPMLFVETLERGD